MNKQTEALKMAIEFTSPRAKGTRVLLASTVNKACKDALEQPAQEAVERDYHEEDGCPTELAVLQRFWRKHQQPAQEPVLIQWYDEEEDEWEDTDERYYQHYADNGHKIRFLYTHPAPSWQGLSDDDIKARLGITGNEEPRYIQEAINDARAIEQVLKLNKQTEALNDDIEEMVQRLENWCEAYPTDIFPEITKEELDYINAENKNLSGKFFAHVGRHFIDKGLKPALDLFMRIYNTNPASLREPLSEEKAKEIWTSWMLMGNDPVKSVRTIEQKLKRKNGFNDVKEKNHGS